MILRPAVAVAIVTGLTFGTVTAEEKPAKPKAEFSPKALGMDVPVITPTDDLDKYVGRLVAVRGVVFNSKLASINGVIVDTPDELRGREAYAVGVLGKFVLTEEAYRLAQDGARRQGNVIGLAIPGPGTSYRLYADLVGKLAEARPLPK